MKTINTLAFTLLISFILSACATNKMTFNSSAIVPAATGDVKVKKDKNENYAITVDVLNLAEPQSLTPSREVYLVWMESDQNEVKKLGQIVISSKALKGEMTATSTVQPNRVFITAERDADAQYPDGQRVLTTK